MSLICWWRPRSLIGAILLTLTSCLVCNCGRPTVFVFVGETPQGGAAQIATNEPIPLVIQDADGDTHTTEQPCGQHVVIPVYIYRQMIEQLASGGAFE